MPSFTWKIDTQEEAQAIASPSSKEVKPHSITSSIDFPTKEKKIKKTKTSIKKKKKNHDFKLTKLTPVLHYVLVIKRKEGQSPFSGDEESRLKDLQGLTLPVAKITKPKPSSQPLKGFTRPSQGPIIKHGTLPTKRTKKGFDPNASRLMAKVGYNHEKLSGLGKLIPEASRKEGQKTSKAKDVGKTSSKAGIGYTPPTPIHIPIRKASVLVILANDKEEEKSSKLSKKPSVFYLIGQPTPHISVFDRLGTKEDDNIVNGTQSSALTRLSYTTSSQLSKDEKLRQKQNKMSNFLHRYVDNTLLMDQDSNEVRNSIPSRMKRRSIWEVNTREALTAKKCTMVSTKQKVEDEVAASVNHITIIEDTKEDSPIEDYVEDAPPTFEEGVQATIDELKEVNIGTTKDPRPIFINANLSLEEEDAYVKLLK